MNFSFFLISVFLVFNTATVYADEIKKVKLQLQWKHQFEFAGFYAAKEKGFYKDVGLDVEFIEYDKTTNIIDSVITQKTQFGLTYASLITEYMAGKPIVFLANYFKQSPLVLVSQEEIKIPQQLKGKKVMGVSDQIDSITLKLMLEKFDIGLDDIENIPTTFNIEDFVNKKVDAMAVFTTNEIFELKKRGVKYNIFNPSVYGHEYYDVNLFTSKEYLQNNPLVVEKFREASNKGWKYALENQYEITEIILEKYNSQNKTKEALLFEAKQIEQIMLSKVQKIGSIDEHRVKQIASSFIESGYSTKEKYYTVANMIYKNQNESPFFKLQPYEQTYLDSKDNITMCVDRDWEPYEKLDRNGKYSGLAAEYVKLIEKRINKEIKLIPLKIKDDSLKVILEAKCETLSFVNANPEKEVYFNFSPTIYREADVIATRDDVAYIDSINELDGKILGLVKNYKLNDYISQNYPDIEIVYVDSQEKGLKLVSDGSIYATVGSLLGTLHLIKKNNLENVKITGKTAVVNEFKIGVVKDETILKDILSKAILSISVDEKEKIKSNTFLSQHPSIINYETFLKIGILFLIIFLFLFYRHYVIRRINKELKEKMELQYEQLVEKDRLIFEQNKLVAMAEMIENIAHQWRQPLSQINSSVLLIDNELNNININNDTVYNKLEDIEELTKYMSRTIDDFRSFYSKETQKEEFHLYKLMEKSLAIFHNDFEDNKIEVMFNFDRRIMFLAYPNELQQVLLVILNNAKDALITNGKKDKIIKIDIYISNHQKMIRICDNAGGIDSSISEKIFEPYFTTKPDLKGMGLGLHMAKVIFEERRYGQIRVENQNGGACFYIELVSENE